MISNTRIELFDGAMGTELSGLPQAQHHFIEELNLLCPDRIVALHKAYLEAGSDYLTTNSFSLSPCKWESQLYDWKTLADAAIANARQALQGYSAKLLFDIGPSGRMMPPIGTFSFEEAYRNIAAVVEHTKDRVDGYIVETYSDLYEIKAAVLAIKEHCSLPVFATMTFDPTGRTLTGSTPEIVAYTLTALGVDVVGANCSNAPDSFVELVRRMRQFTHLPILAQPNKGLPVVHDGKVCYHFNDQEFAHWTEKIIEAGASIVGGFCGTSPSTIQALANFKQLKRPLYDRPKACYICSATQLLELRKGLICGERLNPTGKKKLQQALREADFSYLQQEAQRQAEAGAHYLDLNVGIPNCDETTLLCQAVEKVQATCSLPLQLDSSKPEAIEAAIRVYNGVPLINSINGSTESLQALLPVLAKYGAPAVALPLDSEGIPESCDGRMAIVTRILTEAKKWQIDSNRFVFDALVMTISSDQKHAQVCLDCLNRFHEMGLLTTIGLSNVSFGLPDRASLNRTFLSMALAKGLDMPIMNPLDKETTATLKAFMALAGHDTHCQHYLAYHQQNQEEASDNSLFQVVLSGWKEQVAERLREALMVQNREEVIQQQLIPALEEVGKRFEAKKIFLPQLIQSAETAKVAFDLLMPAAEACSCCSSDSQLPCIVLATVKGDIHDIGKNIVKVVLQSHGYRVVDLGKDVAKERVAEACRQHRPLMVGLSALMTTTVDAMQECIAYLRAEGLTYPVVVGGAVLTQETARDIRADFYAEDALATVSIADRLRQTTC